MGLLERSVRAFCSLVTIRETETELDLMFRDSRSIGDADFGHEDGATGYKRGRLFVDGPVACLTVAANIGFGEKSSCT
jgi:hypothetical protein